MIARYNRLSFLFGVPGLILQGLSFGAVDMGMDEGTAIFIRIVGTVLLMIGLALYAKAKGRSPWWCLMGFLSIIGLIVLGALKNMSPPEGKNNA